MTKAICLRQFHIKFRLSICAHGVHSKNMTLFKEMNMKCRRILFNVVILTLCMAGLANAAPMGTAFTYQGRLMDANSPADGLYDFEFAVYDALDPDEGIQQGSTVIKDDVDVIDSYFTVELDFGSSVFIGDARWLQIAVRPGASSDPCDFATLSPRQELTPTPYAMHSENADKLDSYDASAFASSVHNHDGVYAVISHDHDGVYALISHTHDDRYYTEEELRTSGSASVHWSNMLNIPAGIADGDDDTQLSEAQVDAYVSDNGYISSWGDIPDIPVDIADGDNDTHLSETQVETYIANDVSTGYLPYDNGTKLITSNVYYDIGSGNVGIGSTDPEATLDVNGSMILQNGPAINEFSTDGTLEDNSNDSVPTEKAVKTYVDNQISAGSVGVVPLGGVVAWLKSFPNTPSLPSGFIECNGQLLTDPNSPYEGQTIPNLNGASAGTQRFLRGSTTSGSTGGSESHTHTMPQNASAGVAGGDSASHNANTGATSTLPSYYEVVWIMRVK